MAKNAAEIIAFVLGQDYADMKEARYQPTKTSIPVYVIGEDYYCSPTAKQKLPGGFIWIPLSTAYGRTVYKSKGSWVAEVEV